MKPKILDIGEKKLVGMRTSLSLSKDTTRVLWQKFMPRRHEVKNAIADNFFSIQVYDRDLDMNEFTPQTVFEKWAAIEVTHYDEIPQGMESHILKGGKYAVFIHRGPASTFSKTLQLIYTTWLPNSGYALDKREHFEILNESYSPNDPNATEEVWIPISKVQG